MKYILNKELAEERNLSDEKKAAIQIVGEQLYGLLHRPDLWTAPHEIATIVSSYEYVLQGLWGFPYDPHMHSYQLHINGCKCKELMDNKDWVRGHFWVNPDCPFHSNRRKMYDN